MRVTDGIERRTDFNHMESSCIVRGVLHTDASDTRAYSHQLERGLDRENVVLLWLC